ncbi:MAG TPA: GAF domain-containing protein [Acidimicrobiia bacterium]|nr:GAF domain-containing protein [Acidimicrobiia bacterium]
MAGSPDPVLQSVLDAALDATGATRGWVLAIDDDALALCAIAGAGADLLGHRVGVNSGFAGFVASSGQPVAMRPRSDDPRGVEGVAALVGERPLSVLAVPAGSGEAVHGVIELVDKHGGGPFSFDDVEIATLLGNVAGTALVAASAAPVAAPSPTELGSRLARLAASDPARYLPLAQFLADVLADD